MSQSMAAFLWARDANLYIIAAVSLAVVIVWYLTRRSSLARHVLGSVTLGVYLLVLLAGLMEL